ncbi:hypothetical protein CI109_105818 [Kwoniella shandongensis]|uniref:Uncharacterized protein n=1 Tax=Kwoniella shandongensis TaxID=1734106 RepID=A0A5M6C562_9TREE|nr:uncharacterized protein CI109_003157 [Kwoniella shandongensis]KAA5528625.1 hypothetical protein CI109_003157 [Kwoniella shandongensis]
MGLPFPQLLLVISLATAILQSQAQTTSSEFVGCLNGDFKPISKMDIKSVEAKKSYYECADACVASGGYSYSYFTDLGKGSHKCSCSSVGPKPADYVVQPIGSFGCRMGQTRAALTRTDHHFIVCSSGFIGSFVSVGTYSSPQDCFRACENEEGALFLPSRAGFKCRCGGVTSVKSVAACGAPNAEFSYVNKPTKNNKTKKGKKTKAGAGGSGRGGKGGSRKKLGKGGSSPNRYNEDSDGSGSQDVLGAGEKKVYENPCDDPDSILGYCGFGEEDIPVF